MKTSKISLLIVSLMAMAAQAQSVTQIDSNILIRKSPLVVRNQTAYEPIVSNYSSMPSGIYKSGIIFLADQLERNVEISEKKRPTVVTSFSSLDDLSVTSSFGRLVGEHLMHELHIRGWVINDIRLASSLTINSNGEFSLSRDIKQLRSVVPAANIVTGTYTTSSDGLLLSVKVIDFSTGQLISSAETRFKIDEFMASLIYKPRSTPNIKLTN